MSNSVVKYTIQASNPNAHVYTIECQVNQPEPLGQSFYMPAWIPGSYMIRDFAKHVVSFSAKNEKGILDFKKVDKQTWLCAPSEIAVTVVYEVYAWDLSVRGAHLDTTHGYFNGATVFLAVKDQEQAKCELVILAPEGSQYLHWRVATSMSREKDSGFGNYLSDSNFSNDSKFVTDDDSKKVVSSVFKFGRYRANNYSDLIDHPVEMGDLDIESFTVAGVPHYFVVFGKHHADLKRIVRDVKLLCEHHVDLFGELPEMHRYVFLVTCVGVGYGGLEHRASCSLICSRNDFPRKHEKKISDEYRNFLSLCSHEYFHTWNVKRLKPKVFIPEKLNKEIHTQLLWAFEGITSYYDDLSLCRTKLIPEKSYLELLAKQITRYLRTPGRKQQTVTESSFDAWTKFYKQDENAVNSIVSYYNKGALIACLLDLEIRKRSEHKLSLDNVMLSLWEKFGRTECGVEEKLEQEIAEMVNLDLSDFFNDVLYSKQELVFNSILKYFGVGYNVRRSKNLSDNGGSALAAESTLDVYFGANIRAVTGRAVIASVLTESPFQLAGLAALDQLVAIDNIQVTATNFEALISRYQANDLLKIHAFRGDQLMQFEVILKPAKQETVYLESEGDHKGWLGVKSSKV